MVLRSRLSFWQRAMYSWWTLGLLMLLLLILARGTFDLYQKNTMAQYRKDIALQELHGMEERRADLTAELGRIKTTGGIEAELRHKFDVAREGEHLLVVVDKEVTPSMPPPRQSWWDTMRALLHF